MKLTRRKMFGTLAGGVAAGAMAPKAQQVDRASNWWWRSTPRTRNNLMEVDVSAEPDNPSKQWLLDQIKYYSDRSKDEILECDKYNYDGIELYCESLKSVSPPVKRLIHNRHCEERDKNSRIKMARDVIDKLKKQLHDLYPF